VKRVQDKVISIDQKDEEMWKIITDVPHFPAPWQYVLFVLSVLIPGKLPPP